MAITPISNISNITITSTTPIIVGTNRAVGYSGRVSHPCLVVWRHLTNF